mmetsp:Transcript_8411/g.21540  ORF Transcript_8411/g.21540 Transcript_8411/m.21540 type:complete len:207 (+) Transcript_8411:69-689(+)
MMIPTEAGALALSQSFPSSQIKSRPRWSEMFDISYLVGRVLRHDLSEVPFVLRIHLVLGREVLKLPVPLRLLFLLRGHTSGVPRVQKRFQRFGHKPLKPRHPFSVQRRLVKPFHRVPDERGEVRGDDDVHRVVVSACDDVVRLHANGEHEEQAPGASQWRTRHELLALAEHHRAEGSHLKHVPAEYQVPAVGIHMHPRPPAEDLSP